MTQGAITDGVSEKLHHKMVVTMNKEAEINNGHLKNDNKNTS